MRDRRNYKDIRELLENAGLQHIFARMFCSVGHMDYNERLKALALCTLERKYEGFSHPAFESLCVNCLVMAEQEGMP